MKLNFRNPIAWHAQDNQGAWDLSLVQSIIASCGARYKQVASLKACPPPPEDELSQSTDKLTKQGLLSAAHVFEACLYLDIQDTMGDNIGRGYEDLVRNTKKIDEIMNLGVIDGSWDVGGTGEHWNKREVDVVMRIRQTSMFWIDGTANKGVTTIQIILSCQQS